MSSAWALTSLEVVTAASAPNHGQVPEFSKVLSWVAIIGHSALFEMRVADPSCIASLMTIVGVFPAPAESFFPEDLALYAPRAGQDNGPKMLPICSTTPQDHVRAWVGLFSCDRSPTAKSCSPQRVDWVLHRTEEPLPAALSPW